MRREAQDCQGTRQGTLLAASGVQHDKRFVQAPAKYAGAKQRRAAPGRFSVQGVHIYNVEACMAALAGKGLLDASSHSDCAHNPKRVLYSLMRQTQQQSLFNAVLPCTTWHMLTSPLLERKEALNVNQLCSFLEVQANLYSACARLGLCTGLARYSIEQVWFWS